MDKSKFKTQGRTAVVGDRITLDFSGSGIELNAMCEGDITVTFESTVNDKSDKGGLYFSVYVDGVKQAADLRVPTDNGYGWTSNSTGYPFHITSDGTAAFTVASGLEYGEHTVAIYNQSEPDEGLMSVKSIEMNGYLTNPPENKAFYIEVIGDSIAAGHGNISAGEARGALYQDATEGWGIKSAMALDADWSIVAISGITATENIGWEGAGSLTMPTVYVKQRYHSDQSTDYAFSRIPDVIVVSLGTNDVNSQVLELSGKDIGVVSDGIKDMLSLIRKNNPNSKIVWLYGMMTDEANEYILDAIEDGGGAAKGLYALQLSRDTSGGNLHPSAAAQNVYAEAITSFIREICK